MRLLGRADETAALRALLDRAGQGRSGVLVVHGEAGVGKTALLNDAAARADGFRIARVDGVESERELGYAGLHRLLLPLLDGTASLPAPQRDALGGVFGLVAGVAPDRLLIGLAVLTLLTDAGLEQPLLCVCDDAQWLDTETLEVLAFVGRRLQADHVALLFGVRDGDGGSSALRDLPRMHVGGLPDDAAHRLLDAAGPRRLDPEVARRVVAETRGNPLAIRELAGDLARDPRTGGPPAAGEAPPLAERLPLGRLIEERFRRQVAALPPDVRTLLLVVAAEPTGNAHLVWRALHRLEATGGASGPHALAAPAVAADLLVLRPVLGFRHPLIRSGVYAGADEAERRRVHAALAAVTDPVADGDRRAWHLAAAAPGPDEELARELERSAERARARGGYAAQSALLVQAAELTPSGPRHAARLLAAAPGALRAGQPVPALELLDRAGPDLDEDGRIAADRMRGTGYIQLGRSGDAVPLLLGAAERTVARDRDAAADLLVETLHATTVANWERCRDDARRLAEVALSLEPGTRFPDLLLAGHAEHLARGGAAAAPALRRALAAARAGDALAAGRESWYVLVFVAAMELWDDDAFDDLTGRGVAIARELGAFATLQTAVHSAGMIEMWRGDFTRARAYFAEFVEVLNMVSGSPGFAEPSDVTLKAWRGERDRVAASLDYLEDNQHAPIFGGNILVLYLARCARVVLATGGSRYAEVIAEARRAYAENLPYGEHFTLPDFVEAGVRGGDREVAREGMRRLTERALAAGTPWALGLLARSRALLAPDDGAEPHYQEAIDLLGGTRVRTDLARAHLLYGEWLRRRRRRGDARARLRTAHEMFTGMGAAAFAERARLELRAIGDRVAGRAASGGGRELTAQERRVAELAAAGATNAEIATQLFVSASTVEYHLRKVFRKLGITSRRQLARDQLL